MKVEYINPFIESINDVFSTMLDSRVERGQPNFNQEDTFFNQHVVVKLEFSGTAKGFVLFFFPSSTAMEVAKKFTGLDFTLVDNSVIDSVSEIANIVAGGAKAKMHSGGEKPIDLSVPEIIQNKDNYGSLSSQRHWLEIPFTSDLGNFFLRVTIEIIPS